MNHLLSIALVLSISVTACVDAPSVVSEARVELDPYDACNEQASAWCPAAGINPGACRGWYVHECMTSGGSKDMTLESQEACIQAIYDAGSPQLAVPCQCMVTWGVSWCQDSDGQP